MKLLFIIFIISIISIGVVNAQEICLDPILPNITCLLATPVVFCSGDYYYFVYDNNSNVLEYGNLTPFTTDTYYFPFNYDIGTYYIEICDGSTRQIIIGGDTMIGFTSNTWVLGILILLFILFLILSFRITPIFMVLCGIIFIYFGYYTYTELENLFITIIMGLLSITLIFIGIIGTLYKD